MVLEGPDGSGKSTQARLLADRLGALCTREPGDTSTGRRVRELLLDPEAVVCERAEALLMAADRAQHVAELVGPMLESGRDVVSDRYSASSIAYQGYGRGLPVAEVAELSRWATDGLQPDLVIMLEVPVEVTLARLGGRHDRLEALGREFHLRILSGYRRLAADNRESWVVIDGTAPVDEVHGAVWAEIDRRWPSGGPTGA